MSCFGLADNGGWTTLAVTHPKISRWSLQSGNSVPVNCSDSAQIAHSAQAEGSSYLTVTLNPLMI